MTMMGRPCPNEDLGAADVAQGQRWRHYLTDPRFAGTYKVDDLMRGDGTIFLSLDEAFDHGPDAYATRIVDVGALLACWLFVTAP